MRNTTMWVVFTDSEGDVVCHETNPEEIVDYCMQVGFPQWSDTDAEWYTDEAPAREAERRLRG